MGLTQNVSVSMGSRTVMWPATPSSKPNLPKMRECCSEPLFALELLRGGIQPLAGHRRQIGIHHQLINLFVHDCSLLFSRQCRAASRASSPAVGNDSPRAER